ncbi:hypothetical protein GALL_443810 [mine drainage metagenome]|uniref:Uncharacterized protein n=1 Tax=mine drainage metagenome TaxID=410659 RepID=A0A1J5PR52_9ZZZZ
MVQRVGHVVLQGHGDDLRRRRAGIGFHLALELLDVHMRVALEFAHPGLGRAQHARQRPVTLQAHRQRDEQQNRHDVKNPARGLGEVCKGVEGHDQLQDKTRKNKHASRRS